MDRVLRADAFFGSHLLPPFSPPDSILIWNCSLAESDYILQGDMETWTAPQTIYSPADVPRSAGKVPQPRSHAPSRLAEDHQLDKSNMIQVKSISD